MFQLAPLSPTYNVKVVKNRFNNVLATTSWQREQSLKHAKFKKTENAHWKSKEMQYMALYVTMHYQNIMLQVRGCCNVPIKRCHNVLPQLSDQTMASQRSERCYNVIKT